MDANQGLEISKKSAFDIFLPSQEVKEFDTKHKHEFDRNLSKSFVKLKATKNEDKEEAENDFKNNKEPQKDKIFYKWITFAVEKGSELTQLLKKDGYERNYFATMEELKKRKVRF